MSREKFRKYFIDLISLIFGILLYIHVYIPFIRMGFNGF